MADRFFVMGQVFIADGTTTTDKAGRQTTDQTITVTGGAGNFTIYMTQGMTGTVTSGTTAITGSPVTLNAGVNTLVADGDGDCTMDITIGSAANWDSVQSWSAASGGTGGASVPTSSDDGVFDANSFTAGSQTVTVDATASCLDLDWTGTTNTPDLAGSADLYTAGDVTYIAAMTTTYSGLLKMYGTITFTSAGKLGSANLRVMGATSLGDAFTTTGYLQVYGGKTLTTNSHNITCGGVRFNQVAAHTINLGTSTITCTSWTIDTGGTLTVTTGASTIKVSGTGGFNGGGQTFYNVELNGTAHTIAGSNTFSTLTLKADTTQTITFTDGTTQTITTPVFTGSSGKIKTLTGTGTAGWTVTKVGGGEVTCDYMNISYGDGQPQQTWIAGVNSTKGAVTTDGWLFGRHWAERRSGWQMLLAGRY